MNLVLEHKQEPTAVPGNEESNTMAEAGYSIHIGVEISASK